MKISRKESSAMASLAKRQSRKDKLMHQPVNSESRIFRGNVSFMKKLILIFLLFSLNKVEAQIPDYFGNNPAWSCGFWCSGGEGCPSWPEYPMGYGDAILYYFDGEQTFGTNTYHKLYKKIYRYDSVLGPDPVETWNLFVMYVRQEGRAIYFYNSGQDSLFISYDLSVGDFFGGHYGTIGTTAQIEMIDSVLVGTTYRYIFYPDTMTNSVIIEGIGYLVDNGLNDGGYFGDPYTPYIGLGFSYSLTCYGENNVSLWPIPGASCGLTLDMVEEINFSSIEIFPNPVTDILNINLGNEQIQSVEILNLQGQIVQLGENEIVDVSHLETGVYIISIITTEGNTFRKQFIKI